MTTETPKPVEVTQAAANTDRELYREREGDYYANSLHVTQTGGIGINVGGYVIVKSLSEWHRLSTRPEAQALPTVSEDQVDHLKHTILIADLEAVELELEPAEEQWAKFIAKAVLAALSTTVSEAPEDDLERIAIEDLAQRVRQMRIAGEELAALSPTVSEADEADEAVKQLIRGSMSRDFERRYTVSEADRLAAVHVVFDGPPSHESGRFVECEAPDGRSINIGEWYERKSGFWELRIPLRAQPSNEADGWRDIASAPKDGSEILILAHGMAIQARYCPGRWGDETPDHPAEYDGAVWCAFDDAVQFEIEEGVGEHGEDWNGPVTHWRPLPAAPGVSVQAGGEVERLARAFVAKLDECQPYIDTAFVQMANHGMPYTGPQYGEELDALRAALNPEGSDHAG